MTNFRNIFVIKPHYIVILSFVFRSKVAATVAKELNIPMEMVAIKPSDSFVEPNNSVTGGSMTSELCVNVS